jgi:alkylation response protein AidB-like acyl-CoA dehydrogenase
MVRMCKKIVLMAAGTAANKFMAGLAEEQEVLGMLADMIIEIYAMESGLLRAKKFLNEKGEDKAAYHTAVIKVYVNDSLPKIANWAKQILAHAVDEDSLAAQYAAVDKLASYQPVNTIELRRTIADRVIKGKKYPF